MEGRISMSVFEVGLRFEPTPPSFTLFDLALGVDGGTHWCYSGYYRLNATLSHRFGGVEPYVYAARYSRGNTFESPFGGTHWLDEIVDVENRLTSNTRTVGAGVALPLGDFVRIVPEYRYDWYTADGGFEIGGLPGAGYLGMAMVFGPWRPRAETEAKKVPKPRHPRRRKPADW